VDLEVHPDEMRRAESVAMSVKLAVAGGRAPSDIMVLGRTWKALAAVEAELRALDVPCDYPKREADAWRSVPMRWLVSAMRLHTNARDGIALRRVLSWPTAACSEAQILRAEVRSKGATLAELRRDGTGGARLVQVQADTAGEFASKFAATSDAWETLAARSLDEMRDDLDAAVARIVAWTERRAAAEQDVSIKAFLAWYTFRDVRDAEAQATPSVRLMTVHAAKGLEAPVVHFIGPDRGVFPKVGEDERGEELRLWYVAVTRARDQFTAHASMEVTPTWGPTRTAGPSPFAAYLADPDREAVAS
jgi:DNA helicase-2/ATP-dependent DNA helicase PcrA